MDTEKLKIKTCRFCGKSLFSERVKFRGTTEFYFNSYFFYAKCSDCGSISNLSLQVPNYANYVTGEKTSKLKVKRFTKLLEELKVSKMDKLLDYGCGNGALLLELNVLGYNILGYEPFNKKYSRTLENNYSYDLVYLTHVFEHLDNYDQFFLNLKKVTHSGSLLLTIHPSATRISALNASCPFQSLVVHAPFHLGIPSDKAVIELFQRNGFKLKLKKPYDLQRSGPKDNSRVSALLFRDLGGTKERMLGTPLKIKLKAAFNSPFEYFYNLFINTKDIFASTLVFERI